MKKMQYFSNKYLHCHMKFPVLQTFQIQDMATATRMTTLGSRAKRLQLSLLQPLEHLRSDIVYHLTALELQIKPWAQQVNRSLSHLKQAQQYLDTHAANVCLEATETFRERYCFMILNILSSFYIYLVFDSLG